MAVAIITGSSGLIGSEAAKFLHEKGFEVIGIDNDLRGYFFGSEASTGWKTRELQTSLKHFTHYPVDIRDQEGIFRIFQQYGADVQVVIHTAAQPSHDWAAREPFTDFTINANGTHVLLEATRLNSSDAPFIFISTNKVYGDLANFLPLLETETRWEVVTSHPYAARGIDETMSIDQSTHSLFGVSKAAADLLVQEYGKYFGLKTCVFRGGCLTGPAHSAAELHGFLAYLCKCIVTGSSYTIYGHKGKQVRDNIHSFDLVNAFWHFLQSPRIGEVYNIGGSRHSNCSILEAIALFQRAIGKELTYSISSQSRTGDHIWWITDVSRFQAHYPGWKYEYDLDRILQEIVDAMNDRYKGPLTAQRVT